MDFVLLAVIGLSFTSATEPQINAITSQLEKAVSFLENNYDQVNMDGVAGFAMLKDLLEDTLKRWSLSGPEAESQYARTEDLFRRMSSAVKSASKEVQFQEPIYFDAFEQVLEDHFWTFRPVWTQTDMKLVYPKRRVRECFHENISDMCLSQLLGTWKDHRVPCLNTLVCRKLMSREICQNYSLSHQLLYYIIAEMKNCKNIIGSVDPKSRSGVSLQQRKKVYCTNMMHRNLEIEEEGFPIYLRDLFLENILLCGMIGYSDFYKARWLKAILPWQHSSGCYERHGNCSSHMTSIAAGALGSYLRFYGIRQNITELSNV
ncbi:UPF0764 protein C16orf89 homolog [Narcine bancroftii]|uniref:UPF0764 protein C16orf89 homolog n=1 Tax=Narcine bancroftii TaxID=1343680 RepID=UPI003831A471